MSFDGRNPGNFHHCADFAFRVGSAPWIIDQHVQAEQGGKFRAVSAVFQDKIVDENYATRSHRAYRFFNNCKTFLGTVAVENVG